MKKYMRLALFILLTTVCLFSTALAAETSGTCGENLTWHIESTVLHIEGTGPMYDYTYSAPAPWYDSRESISMLRMSEGITTVGNYAFYQFTNLSYVALPSTLTSIGASAFTEADLGNVILPAGLKHIGNSAFNSCSNLFDAPLPAGLETIGERAFWGTALYNVTIPHSVTTLGAMAYRNCTGLVKVVIGDGVTAIERMTFAGCTYLEEVTVGSSVTAINDNPDNSAESGAFYDCNRLRQVTFRGKAPAIAPYTFNRVSYYSPVFRYPFAYEGQYKSMAGDYGAWKTVTWEPYSLSGSLTGGLNWTLTPDGVLSVYGSGQMPNFTYAASTPWYDIRQQITSLIVCEGVRGIGSAAFANLTALTHADLPRELDSIADSAFSGCSALKRVEFRGSAPVYVADNAFRAVSAIVSYHTENNWAGFATEGYGGDLTWDPITDVCCHRGAWQPWAFSDSLPTDVAGKYYLTQDVNLKASWVPTKEITLCLNGYAITNAAPALSFPLISSTTRSLTITNCVSSRDIRYGTWVDDEDYRIYDTPFKGLDGGYSTQLLTGGLICGGVIKSGSQTGAAIYSGHNLTLKNITVADCYGINDGGAVYMNNSYFNCTLDNCRFTGNYSGNNGALYLNAKTLTVTDCSFENNHAADAAGAVQFGDNGAVSFSNCNFLNNTNLRGSEGGAVSCATSSSATNPPVHFSNCRFSGNYSNTTGGALDLRYGSFQLADCVIENNTAAVSGGGIYLAEGVGLTLQHTTVQNNYAGGGGNRYRGDEGTGGGIAVYATNYRGNCTVTLDESHIENNTALRAGGGIANVSFAGGVTVHPGSNTTVQNNTAAGAVNNLDVRNRNSYQSTGDGTYPTAVVTCGSAPGRVSVGITADVNTPFTSGYSAVLPDTDPATFFTSDLNASTVVLDENGEVMLHKHTFGDYIYNNDATCTANGTKTATCTGCTVTDTKTDYDTMLDHSFTDEPSDSIAVPADCENAAVHYVKCDNCSAVSDSVTAPYGDPRGHIFASIASDQLAADADCINPSRYYVRCNFCSAVSDSVTVAVGSFLGHSFTDKPSTNPASPQSCTAPATYFVRCNRCDAISADRTVSVGEVADHSFTDEPSDSIAVPADCENAAVHYVKCDNCSAVSDSKTVAVGEANGHSFTRYTDDNNATYVTDGTETATCDNCDETDTRTIPGSATGPTAAAAVSLIYDPNTRMVMVTGLPADLRVALALYEGNQFLYIHLWEDTAAGVCSLILPEAPTATDLQVFLLTKQWQPIGAYKEKHL